MNTFNPFLNLPDDILYIVVTFIKPPTYRASVLCHQLAPLNSSINLSIQNERSDLWTMILNEYTLKINVNKRKDYTNVGKKSKTIETTQRRASKRLCHRRTVKKEVQEMHLRLHEQSETAHYLLAELAHSKKKSLSLKHLRYILKNHGGPLIRYNRGATIGGTFLVECCRARFVKESVILSCVKELIEKCGASTDVSSGNAKGGLTPLCIASARGMPSVVKYLLKAGASIDRKSTGSFRLYSNPNKSITGTFTPLEFAKAMREAEIKCGVDMDDLVLLNQCIKILSKKDKR